MDIEPEDLAKKYAAMGVPELIEFARSYDSLTDRAQRALRAEFAHRKLDPPEIDDSDQSVPGTRELVTLRRYRDLSEAIVARTLLESAGIPVYLRDENLVRLDWQISNFIGGLRLQVEAADEPAAIELLTQQIPASISFDGEDEFVQPFCPRCGSPDITFEGSSRGAALASLAFLAIPLPLGRKTWLCNVCEARWEVIDESESGVPPGQ